MLYSSQNFLVGDNPEVRIAHSAPLSFWQFEHNSFTVCLRDCPECGKGLVGGGGGTGVSGRWQLEHGQRGQRVRVGEDKLALGEGELAGLERPLLLGRREVDRDGRSMRGGRRGVHARVSGSRFSGLIS